MADNFAVFNDNHETVCFFDTLVAARASLESFSKEYGCAMHVGFYCPNHDEIEHGYCSARKDCNLFPGCAEFEPEPSGAPFDYATATAVTLLERVLPLVDDAIAEDAANQSGYDNVPEWER